MESHQIDELLYQALETELGGLQIYESAIECAVNEDLIKEWQEYLDQTRRHVEIVKDLFASRGLDTEAITAGREIVRMKAQALLDAMQKARQAGDPNAAQLVAAECVVDAETKDHMNWELIGMIAEQAKGEDAKAFRSAFEEVEEEEDEHLYHTQGWTRELWAEALGMKAVLPPPEERKDVKTAIGAARAKNARKEMVRGRK